MKQHKTPPGIAGRAPHAVVDGTACLLVDFKELLRPYGDFVSGIDPAWESRHPKGMRHAVYASAEAMEKELDRKGGDEWRGGIGSMQDLQSIFGEGWTDYYAKGGKVRNSIVSGFQSIAIPEAKVTRHRDRRRGRPNVRRFERWKRGLYTEPFFDRTQHTDARMRGIRLYVPFVFSCGTPEIQILVNGIAAVAMAEALQAAGWKVEVYAWSCIMDPKVSVLYRVMRAGQRVAWDRIAAGLAHAGTFRTFGIAAYAEALIANNAELPPDVNIGGGYGLCRNNVPQDELDETLEALGEPTTGYSIALPFMGTERAAVAAIRSVCSTIQQQD